MAEIYSFTARVVARRKYRIGISPEDRDAFMDYLERVGLSGIRYFHKGPGLIWVNNRNLVEAASGADRVRYSVEMRSTRMFGVKLEPLP
jgi:hypothetical protein